jgi:hypothetical protein
MTEIILEQVQKEMDNWWMACSQAIENGRPWDQPSKLPAIVSSLFVSPISDFSSCDCLKLFCLKRAFRSIFPFIEFSITDKKLFYKLQFKNTNLYNHKFTLPINAYELVLQFVFPADNALVIQKLLIQQHQV